MESKRIAWVDYLKYFCFMMVIISHLESNNVFLDALNGPVTLAGFFFTSGYTYKHRESFKAFFTKKIKGLFIPWLIWSLFIIVTAHIVSFNEHESIIEELKWNFLQIRERGDVLWFVSALFVVYIPFYFIIKLYEKHSAHSKSKWVLLAVTLILALAAEFYIRFTPPGIFPWKTPALPWHIEYIPIGIFKMTLGYIFKTSFEKVFDENRKTKYLIIASLLYIAIYLAKIFLMTPVALMIEITYIHSVIGLYILIYICKLIKKNRYMLYVGANTLLGFALHGKVYSVVQTLAKKLFGAQYRLLLGNVLTGSVVAVVIAIIVSFIMIIPIWIVNRYVPFFAGKPCIKKEK